MEKKKGGERFDSESEECRGEGVHKHARTRQRSVSARGKNRGKNNCNMEVRLGQSSRHEM